uniref:Uncharacterized protein n=1 Tax=Rhizophora mucronata TaxID=61149 RepID=A0A2P2QZ87_RHIMU
MAENLIASFISQFLIRTNVFLGTYPGFQR